MGVVNILTLHGDTVKCNDTEKRMWEFKDFKNIPRAKPRNKEVIYDF